MRRSLAATSALAALLVGAAVPLLGSAGAAACPSWTDPKGDASTGQLPDPAGVIGDNNLDITGATLKSDGTNLVATITVASLGASSSDAGDEHRVVFTLGGKTIQFYSDRTIISGNRGPAGNGAGFYNSTDDELATGATATYDTKTSTVTITGTLANLAKVLGAPLDGKAATNLRAETLNQVAGATIVTYDAAAAQASTSFVVATACGGTGGPAPTTPPTSAPPTASPSPTPSPTTGGPAPVGYPATGCNDIVDPKGDGKPTPATVAGTAVALGNDPDLDILGAAFQTTDTELKSFIRIDKLGNGAAQGDGHRFEWAFTFAGKAFVVVGGQYGTVSGVQQQAGLVSFPYTSVGGTRNNAIKTTQVFDKANNMVVFGVNKADLATVGGQPLTGALTGVSLTSKLVTPTTGWVTADVAQVEKAEERTYTVGVSQCFGPPAAKLLNTGKTTVQYTDAAALAAKLTDSADKPLAGKTVTFAIGAVKKTATTGADGVARASLAPGVVAGAYTLVTSFAGDAAAGKVETSAPFTVTAEATRIVLSVAKSGTRRTVTAKLLDDDGKAVAGQNVNWYVAGKKVSTMRTNAAGVVTLTTAKPTQTVVAEFLAVAGKYAASKATTRV